MGIRRKAPALTARRAEELFAEGQVAYYVLVSYQEGLDLVAGIVPRSLRPQLIALLKRQRAESAEMYAARVAEARR